MSHKKIVVLGTGGTIAGTALRPLDSLGYTSAQIGVEALLAAVPGLSGMGLELVAEQAAQIDSKDMGKEVWQHLLQRCQYWLAQDDVTGLVLTHGTDTLEETAFFLSEVLAPQKPVVLTCAMRPATSSEADGPQNLKDALTLASFPGAIGVTIVCAGQIHGARDVQKVHTTRLDPFSSGDAGSLGRIVDGQVQILKAWPETAAGRRAGQVIDAVISHHEAWPRVEIVLSHAGATGAVVEALLAADIARQCGAGPVRGLVVAATGNGTVHHALETSLLKAQTAGVRVVRSSRCCFGTIVDTGHPGLVSSGGLSPVKARVALLLDLLLEPASANPAG